MSTGETQLSEDEMRFWHALKGISQRIRSRILEDIGRETGLSDPDFSVLIKLCRGPMRQAELAEAIEWHRSRLSHHLSRMEERGLVRRDGKAGNGVVVDVTEAGETLVKLARPVHARAVRKHLIDRLTATERETFERLAAKLMDD